MARIRNVSDHPLELRVAFTRRRVEPDGVVEVPDAVFSELAWPESLWQVVSESRSSSKEK